MIISAKLVQINLILAKFAHIAQEILIKIVIVNLDFMMTEMQSANPVLFNAGLVLDQPTVVTLVPIKTEISTKIATVKMDF